MLTAYFVWATIGLFIGAGARFLYPGPQAMSFPMAILAGTVGALVGGATNWIVIGAPEGPFQGAGIAVAVIASLLVVWLSLANGQRRIPFKLGKRTRKSAR